jgi:AraC-like DNA-binding protein
MDAREDIPEGWRLPDLAGAEIMIGRFRNHRFPRHSHDGLMLSIIDEGFQKVSYRGATHMGGRGQLIAVPPHEVHSGEPGAPEGWRYRTITVPSALISQLMGTELGGFLCETVFLDATLRQALERVFTLFGKTSTLELEHSLAQTLTRFFDVHTAAAAPRPVTGTEARAIHRARDYLAARPDENVRLSELAQASGLDGYRLTRAFTREVGLPPHAWHLQYRLDLAQAMLARGAPLAGAAYGLGFADQAHFTRLFKRHTGRTPARYRAAHLPGR